MTKTAKDIIRYHLKRVYFNGSTDMVARQNGVIPNDTKLGETQIEVELDQALKELEAIHQQEMARATLSARHDEIVKANKLGMEVALGSEPSFEHLASAYSYYLDSRYEELTTELSKTLKEHKD